ncbi:CYCD3-2 [Linum perenne]
MTIMKQHQQHQLSPVLLDGLYCDEDGFEPEEEQADAENGVVLNPQDLLWEEDELVSLISKEKSTHWFGNSDVYVRCSMDCRREAVDWVLRVKAHYGFTALTCVLAVNYFDRFASSFTFQKDKPWMRHLAAVTCLSLAAKVEETQVPLLLDLQTIKRMEILVLSTLKWRMNPVTPISFFDHMIRRLGMKILLHSEFLWRCESLLLSVISDSRFISYLPSILAAATMLHVIKEVEPCNEEDYHNELMSVLKISEDEVSECYTLIAELSGSRKRKHPSSTRPSSPSGVVDASFSCDSSNDSWGVASSSSTSSPWHVHKRIRTQDQQMRLPSQKRTFADPICSPR